MAQKRRTTTKENVLKALLIHEKIPALYTRKVRSGLRLKIIHASTVAIKAKNNSSEMYFFICRMNLLYVPMFQQMYLKQPKNN